MDCYSSPRLLVSFICACIFIYLNKIGIRDGQLILENFLFQCKVIAGNMFYFIAIYKTFELQHMNQLPYMCMKIVPYKFCYIMITLSFFNTQIHVYFKLLCKYWIYLIIFHPEKKLINFSNTNLVYSRSIEAWLLSKTLHNNWIFFLSFIFLIATLTWKHKSNIIAIKLKWNVQNCIGPKTYKVWTTELSYVMRKIRQLHFFLTY